MLSCVASMCVCTGVIALGVCGVLAGVRWCLCARAPQVIPPGWVIMLPTPQSKNNGAVLILGTTLKPQFPLEVLQWQGARDVCTTRSLWACGPI